MKRRLSRIAVLLSVLMVPCAAGAADPAYPTKPVRLIVPSPAGGGMENLARTVGMGLTEKWGHQIVVDTRPGAAGIVGTDIAARAAPDGYTLLLAWVAPLAINPGLYRKLPYDVERDFQPVMLVATTPNILVVSPSVPAKSVREVIDLAKSKPGQLTYASSGIGGSSHLAGEFFSSMAGVRMLHVPYKGTPPALVDLIGGRVQMIFAAESAALPHIRSGKIRALGVTTKNRSPNLPDVPAIAESLPGFEVETWYGLVAPARTSKAVVEKLNAEIAAYLKQPRVRQQLSSQGFEVVASTSGEFSTFMKSELAKWRKVIKEAGIRAE